jgi:hypothetical protein
MAAKKRSPAMTWGLGLEHEFLVAAEESKHEKQPAEVRTLDSGKLVQDIQKSIVHDLCAKIEAAVGKKNALRQLFLAEEAGEDNRITLTPETLKLLKKDRFKGFEKHQAEVIRVLESLSTIELQQLARMFAPLSVCLVSVYSKKTFISIHRIIIEAYTALIKQHPSIKKLPFYIYDDDGEFTHAELVTLMKHVYFRSEEFKMFEDYIADYLGAFLKKKDNKVTPCIGSTASYSCHGHDWLSIRFKENDSQEEGAVPAAPLTPKQLLSVLVVPQTFVRTYKNTFFNIEKDGAFVEVKNVAYKKATVESVVKEVSALQDRVLVASTALTPRPSILPFGGYEFLASEDKEQAVKYRADYAGSYHVWITLPHVRGSTSDSSFSEMHARYAGKLQWLEPLLMACTTGDARAVGKGAAHPRCHMRFMSGIGTTDVCGKMRQLRVLNTPLHYFEDEEAFGGFLETSDNSGTKVFSQPYALDYAHNGAIKPYGACIHIDRYSYGNWDDYLHSPPFPMYSYDTTASKILDKVLKEQYDAKFSVSDGNDIRVVCKGSEIKLRKGWEAFAVKDKENVTVDLPDGQTQQVTKFKILFANRATKERSASAPMAHNDKERAGFEFRFMDNTPLDHMREVMKLLMLVAATCSREDNKAPCTNASSDKDWVQAVANILVKGVHANLARKFVEKLTARFSIVVDDSTPTNVFSFLTWFCGRLHAQEKDAQWFKWLAGSKSAPKIGDLNTEAYGVFLEQRMDWPLARFSTPSSPPSNEDSSKIKKKPQTTDMTMREALADPSIQKCLEDCVAEKPRSQRALSKLCPPLATKEWQHDLPYLLAYSKKIRKVT